uniref:Complex I assembly factor TIMMDC1, mitochondrial n=1 Tax=Scapholeberis mucronata TaxID=202097 RepID=A0A4Y7NL71_9CRUS|nr:EOG090X0FS6 [Scapholeberis mucronata]
MWRLKLPVRVALTLFGVEIIPNNDIIDPKSPTAQRLAEEANRIAKLETGWDRVKAIFRKDSEFSTLSPELEGTLSAGFAGLFLGLFLGGIPASKIEHDDFIRRNKASSFESHFDAKSKMQHSVTKAMAVGGWRVGWRLALFTGGFTFFTTVVSTYRDKSSVFEYTAGGLLAGSLYKMTMGPKAMVAGGLAGSVLGTGAGVIAVGLMTLTGTTTEELRQLRRWKQTDFREVRSSKITSKDKSTDLLSLVHDIELGNRRQMENTLDNGEPTQNETNPVKISSPENNGVL